MSEEEKRRLADAVKQAELRQVVIEAIKEWLNEMFAAFGRWTLGGLAAAALAGLVYLALIGQGWAHK